MIFVREHCKPVENPTARQLERQLSRTRSSYAGLTALDGSYVQIAGGPGLFLLECRSNSGHFRAFQEKPIAAHPDGTTLECSVGRIPMAQDEWFLLRQVVEVFQTFAMGTPWPPYVFWKEVSLEAMPANSA